LFIVLEYGERGRGDKGLGQSIEIVNIGNFEDKAYIPLLFSGGDAGESVSWGIIF